MPAKATQVTTRRPNGPARAGTPGPAKLDFTGAEAPLYGGTGFAVVTGPGRRLLGVDADGDPRTAPGYAVALDALYAAAYAVKVRNKALARRGVPGDGGAERTDFRMPPLERQRGALSPHTVHEARWTLLLRIPDWIDDAEIAEVLGDLEAAKRLPGLSRVRAVAHRPGSWLQTRVDGDWRRALIPTGKAFDVELRERGLAADDGWHEVRLGEPGRPADGYLMRRRLLR